MAKRYLADEMTRQLKDNAERDGKAQRDFEKYVAELRDWSGVGAYPPDAYERPVYAFYSPPDEWVDPE